MRGCFAEYVKRYYPVIRNRLADRGEEDEDTGAAEGDAA